MLRRRALLPIPGIINEDMPSLEALLNKLVDTDDGDSPEDPNGHNSTED